MGIDSDINILFSVCKNRLIDYLIYFLDGIGIIVAINYLVY